MTSNKACPSRFAADASSNRARHDDRSEAPSAADLLGGGGLFVLGLGLLLVVVLLIPAVGGGPL